MKETYFGQTLSMIYNIEPERGKILKKILVHFHNHLKNRSYTFKSAEGDSHDDA